MFSGVLWKTSKLAQFLAQPGFCKMLESKQTLNRKCPVLRLNRSLPHRNLGMVQPIHPATKNLATAKPRAKS